MGIESFFNTISRHTIFENNITSSSLNEPINNITFGKNIYIDFNSIIYNEIKFIETELNYILFEIITGFETDEMVKYIQKYYNLLNLNYDSNYKISLIELKTIFNSENITIILIKQIKKKVIEILKSYNDPSLIHNVRISIDGIPTMPKIIEQKRRRYMNYIIDELKKKICLKYEYSFDNNRKIFEQNKIYVEKTNINYIYEQIISDEFKNVISSILPNLQKYSVSSPFELGEGEKKIIEDIRINNYSGNYVIVSQDSDMIILCIIQHNEFNKNKIENSFKIIRQNIYTQTVEVIDINSLYDSILNHILQRINETSLNKFDINNGRIIDDISFIFSLFGNDFIKKIKSLNIKNGFNIIFEVYIRHLTRTHNKYRYITFEENGIYKINYDNLYSFLYKISENENKLLFETFASKHYKNYGYINSCLNHKYGSPYFYDKINAYIFGFNKLMSHIFKNIDNENENAEVIYETLLLKYYDSEVFITNFLVFEANQKEFDNNEKKSKCIELINKIKNEIIIYGFYRNKLIFHSFSHTINDKFHQKMLKEYMIHPSMLITECDQQIYKLENKLDEYYNIFSSEIDNKLGYFDILNYNGFYKIVSDKSIDKNKDIYYIEKLKIYNKQNKNKLCHSYITGIFWTFDNYFNKNCKDLNNKFISTWSYEYNDSPFIKDLLEYLNQVNNRNKMLNNIFYLVNNIQSIYYVPKDLYFNDLEQFIYITPYEKIKNKFTKFTKITKEYLDKLINNDFFMDLDKIVLDIIDGNTTLHIDCSNSSYLNNCCLLNFKKISYNDFMKITTSLRNK